MKVFRTIRARFTAWYLVVLAILLVALSVGLYAYMSHTLRRGLDRALLHRATQISATRDVRAIVSEGHFEEALGEIVGFYTRGEDGYSVVSTRRIAEFLEPEWIESAFVGWPVYATVNSPTGQPLRYYISLFRPLLPAPAPGAAAQPERAPTDLSSTERGADIAPPEPAVLVVAQPMDDILSALASLRTTLWVAVPLTLLLSAWGGLFLVRRALGPVDRMIETTREIEESDLSRRVEVETHDELGRLASTLNAMLERLQTAFLRQRQFTDDASHELRTPLSVIEAEATLALRRERAPDDYRDALGIIADEAGRMNRLIDQLLTLARSDAGESSRHLESLDLCSIAAHVVGALRPIAEERALSLRLEEEGPVVVRGDAGSLRRLVGNLVENATRHTEAPGAVTISVSSVGGYAVLAVSDTGSGIPSEHLPHIFERFYRVDDARARASGGAGLGLAISRAIAETHGGRIEVESQVGVGSRFTVRLPLDAAAREDTA